jgi:tryptophan-rich sensory protein
MNEEGSLLLPLLVMAAGTTMVAVAGAVLTDISSWYHNLRKPSWKPPDWAFGPIWTVILAMVAIAGALAWQAAGTAGGKPLLAGVLLVNAALHILWNWFFFKLRRPDWALAEVVLLWLSILSMIVVLGRLSTAAGLLLLPYIVWVSVAAFLNYRIVTLNGPFGKEKTR